MFGAKTCHSCTQLEHVFFLMLACMAGIKRGRGRGNLGTAPKFSLPLLTPATQATLTCTQLDATDSNLFLTFFVFPPFMANEALLGRPCPLSEL